VKPISFKRHRFPADVIRHAVWLYFRFSLSFRDVEELLAQRGIDVSYETIRCWTIKFGPLIARRLKRRQPPRSPSDPTTGAAAATVQIPGPSPESPHHPRGDLQHVQHPAPFDQQTHTSAFPRPSRRRLGGRRCLIEPRVGRFAPWGS